MVATVSSRPKQVPCDLQYADWRDGPVRTATAELASELAAARAAVRTGAGAAIGSAMRRALPTAIAMAAQPMPRCADTGGIYADLVDDVYRAGARARSATGPGGLLKAAAMLGQASAVEQQLTAEITHSIGTGHCAQEHAGPAWPPC